MVRLRGIAMKMNPEQISYEDEDPKQIVKTESRWGREKKMRRKKEERREVEGRKRKKREIFFKWKRSFSSQLQYTSIDKCALYQWS